METSKDIREYNVGNSDYSKHKIQPWDIWREYNLNPWDADIVKRILRTKEEPGKSKEDSRIMDYEKIIHICRERIRQIEEDKKAETKISVGGVTTGRFYLSSSDNLIVRPQAPTVTYGLNKKETEAYQKFSNSHYKIHGDPKGCSVSFRNTAVGIAKTAQCNVCNEKEDITDYSGW